MNLNHRSLLFLLIVSYVLVYLAAGAAEPQTLFGSWKHQDIGAVEVKGSASFNQGVFTLQGTLDTWGTNDGFHFAWQTFRGDGEIVARVLAVENTMNHAKAGVMFRESLGADSKHADACVTSVDGTQFLARTQARGKSTASHSGLDKAK